MTEPFDSAVISPATRVSATGARRLTLLYVAALSTVALLTIGAQVLVQWQLENSQSDSRVINIAGRQRMLSQRLAKTSLQLQSPAGYSDPTVKQEMAAALAEWQSNHNALQHGDSRLALNGELSPRQNELFAEVRPHYEILKTAVQQILDATPGADISEAIHDIQEHESAFLEGMDKIVSRCVLEAEGRVARLRNSEVALLALTLLVLIAEGLFIFRPAVRQIKRVVSDLELASLRLIAAKDQAEAASKAKTRFLANVSHELRTPMTAVLGMTELARESTDAASRDHYLTIVEQAGQSLLRLLNDLIDTAKIEAAELVTHEVRFSPIKMSQQVVELMRPLAASKGLILKADFDRYVNTDVLGDEQRLMQVLVNLVGNAIKYTDTGSIWLGLETAGAGPDSQILCWTVGDSGIGIDEKIRGRLFDPFFQADASPEGSRGGAGLGLSICRKILDALGGTIEISSELGSGTTAQVAIELPIAPHQDEEVAIETRATTPTADSLDVLIVEDSPVIQLLLRTWLEGAGHRVTVAADGEQAIDAFASCGADLIVTDYRLGNLNGAQTALRLRTVAEEKKLPAPPIICVTGDIDATGALPHLEVFDAVVMKPIRRNELYRLIDGFISLSSSQTDPEATDTTTDFHREIAAELSRIMPEQLQQLGEALESLNFKTVLLLAHRLRGQVAYFEQGDAEHTLLQLEQAADRKDLEASRSCVVKLRAKLASLLDCLGVGLVC